jgi:hypothetical protein
VKWKIDNFALAGHEEGVDDQEGLAHGIVSCVKK